MIDTSSLESGILHEKAEKCGLATVAGSEYWTECPHMVGHCSHLKYHQPGLMPAGLCEDALGEEGICVLVGWRG